MNSSSEDCPEDYPQIHLWPPDSSRQCAEYWPKASNVEELNQERSPG